MIERILMFRKCLWLIFFFIRGPWDNETTLTRMGSKATVISDEMDFRGRNESDELFEEFRGGELEMGCTIAVRFFTSLKFRSA